MKEAIQVVLLRVGIDTGSGGMLGPLLPRGAFEFIPIDSDRDCLGRTYGNSSGRYGRKFIEYFPDRLKSRMEKVRMHVDPEFESFTYGDPTRPKQGLKKLKRGDLLVFYAGLRGWGACNSPAGLFIIGYFVVEKGGLFNDLKRNGGLNAFARNWHSLNERGKKRFDKLVLIKGGRGSRLLKKAVRISAAQRRLDRGGHPVFVLDPKLKRHFGSFTKMNAIQRSTPRWVKPAYCEKAAKFVLKLR